MKTEFEDRVGSPVDASGLTTPDLVVFDCDGVLVDSEMLSCRLESELLNQLGVPLSTEQVRDQYIGLSYESMVNEIFAGHGVRLPDDFQAVSVERFLNAIETELVVVSGIDELIREITLPICVASSSPLDRIERSLEVTGLLQHFSERIFSSQMVTRGKPAPDLFLLAASECGVAPERCLVVEDSPFGVQGAVAAGMQVIGFTAGGHCREALGAELIAAGAIRVAASSAQLRGLLGALISSRDVSGPELPAVDESVSV